MSDLDTFMAGDRLDDVAFFLHEDVLSSPEALADYATEVDDGVVIVLPGPQGRQAFETVTDVDPMQLASEATQRIGNVGPDLSTGKCPDAEGFGEDRDEDGDGNDPIEIDDGHYPRFVFAFAEGQNEDVGGLYARGDVMHAYASCACGTLYADKWLIGADA